MGFGNGASWTTNDELQWLRSLQKAGAYGSLQRLRVMYRFRRWDGPGMDVDGEYVQRWLDAVLGKLSMTVDYGEEYDRASELMLERRTKGGHVTVAVTEIDEGRKRRKERTYRNEVMPWEQANCDLCG